MQAHELEQIIQQLHPERAEAEVPYLGIFFDEHMEELWYIKANRAGLHQYAADLLRASISLSVIEQGGLPDTPLNSSWLDETGDAYPRFVRFAAGPESISDMATGKLAADRALQVGCWVAALILGGIFLAGIKEITDLLRT